MKKLLFLFLSSLPFLYSEAQFVVDKQYQNIQILQKELAAAKTPEEKTNALISLFIYHTAHSSEPSNKNAAKDYERQLEIFTHETNDPELIARAYSSLIFYSRGEELKKRINRLYEFAKLHDLPFYKSRAKAREADYLFTYQVDLTRATQSINEALNLSKDLGDSLRIIILLEAGFRNTAMNNHFQALQLSYQAYEIASKMRSPGMLRRINNLFSTIYRGLENYNKAIDYNLRELSQLRQLNEPHILAGRHVALARLYFISNQPVLGNHHVQEAYRLADSIKGSKRLYNDITGMTVTSLSRSEYKEILADFLKKYRQHFYIFPGAEFTDDVTLALAYEKIGALDSARFLITKARNYFSDNQTANIRRAYYYTSAVIASHDGNWKLAAENYRNGLQISLAQNSLTHCIELTDSLKTMLARQNMLSEAVLYYKFGDSLKTELARQQDKEDITRQEVAALEREKEMQVVQKEKEKQQRHNVQYLGITFGVVALFIMLLLTGFMKVSPRTIKILSFFSFLLFFEFIFLVFKKQIAVITHGEPLMDLVFMVLLAAIMVPLHHWGEKKVVEYLSTKKISFIKRKPVVTVVRKEVAG